MFFFGHMISANFCIYIYFSDGQVAEVELDEEEC